MPVNAILAYAGCGDNANWSLSVVILGQDPYHGDGQANGLCFSVARGNKIPPSLRNVFKELDSDLGIVPAHHGCLESWAQQGVLLLNSVLTVEAGDPGAHANKGWECFTDQVIRTVSQQSAGVAFMLWGNYAQQKGAKIDNKKHLGFALRSSVATVSLSWVFGL